jgi:phosphoribosylformylglycinamidine cyclo-ligase
MAPTRIYVKPLLALLGTISIHGMAHITGGGLVENIPRVTPDGLEVLLDRKSWPVDPVFDWLQRAGNVSDSEMHRVFNCGIGMTVAVAAQDAQRAVDLLEGLGQPALIIGRVERGRRGVVIA